jgi:kynurenine formamidase
MATGSDQRIPLQLLEMLIQLSYSLSEQTPFYPPLSKPHLRQIYDLAKGDVRNSFYFTSSNHGGTHVHAPRHVSGTGRGLTDYHISELVFSALLDVPLRDNQLIESSHLTPAVGRADRDAHLILLRSDFGRFRDDEPRYVERSPGFGPDAAVFVMESFPELRALTVDFISISSLAHEAAGAEAHRIFLGCTVYSTRPILIVEDALVPNALPPLVRGFIIPWMLKGLNGAPCAFFGEAANA